MSSIDRPILALVGLLCLGCSATADEPPSRGAPTVTAPTEAASPDATSASSEPSEETRAVPYKPNLDPSTNPVKVELQVDRPIDLAAGDLRLVLLEILRDNRCPIDVQCIVAGEAEVSIGVRVGDAPDVATETVSLGTPSGSTETRAEALGYELELLEVLPLPVSTEVLEEEDYRVIVRVRAAPAM